MRLPKEVLILVLDHVGHLPARDVAAMARCSRFLNHELRPRLYHTVTLTTARSLVAFNRLTFGSKQPQRGVLATLFLRHKERHVVHPESQTPALHFVRKLAIPLHENIKGEIKAANSFSVARDILAACPNINTVFLDFNCSEIIELLISNPNVTRLFFVMEYPSRYPILLQRQDGFQNLTHLWVHDLSACCSEAQRGATIRPQTFPALTHIVAGIYPAMIECTSIVTAGVREILHFGRLRRFLLLIPVAKGNTAKVERMSIWHSLAELQDPRVHAMAVTLPYTKEWLFSSTPLWNGLTSECDTGVTWESGVRVWDAGRRVSPMGT